MSTRGPLQMKEHWQLRAPMLGSNLSSEEFRNEVRLLSKVRHRNLVGLVGFCEKPGAKRGRLLVYEYVPNGSLLEYIMGRRESLTWRQRVNIAIGAARGKAKLRASSIVEILDANLLTQPCNTEMMLNMGQLGLRCVMEVPKQRPTMTQVWLELEEALYSVENFINKQRPRAPGRSSSGTSSQSIDQGTHTSMDYDCSQSFVSVNGVGLQRFHVEMDSLSFKAQA